MQKFRVMVTGVTKLRFGVYFGIERGKEGKRERERERERETESMGRKVEVGSIGCKTFRRLERIEQQGRLG